MAPAMRRWHGALRALTRTTATQPQLRVAQHAPYTHTGAIAPSILQSRSFSVHANGQHTATEWALDDDKPEALLKATAHAHHLASGQNSTSPSNRTLRNVLFSPESSFCEAQRAFQQLQTRDLRVTGRHYAALMEKANLEQWYATVRTLFDEFLGAVDSKRVVLYKTPKNTWDYHTSERLQMHRHVLWAMLRGAPSNSRMRTMQRHFRRHELNKSNRIGVYETDALSFLLRMECLFKFAAARTESGDLETSLTATANDGWLERVQTILDEMRALGFSASHSSVHALFHFLMHRADIALAHDVKTSDHETEDQVIQRVLFDLLDNHPRVLDRSPWLVSIAVSTAASASRIVLAVELLRDAEKRHISVDAASFAHVVASAKDDAKRVEIADLYMRAEETNRIDDGVEGSHSMKNYLLLYAIHDGNFTQIMELLHEMAFHKIAATPRTVTALLVSIASYRARIRRQLHDLQELLDAQQLQARESGDQQKDDIKLTTKQQRKLERALEACPTIHQLLRSFPTAIQHGPHTCSLAILQSLRAGDIYDALQVLRAAQQESIELRAEIFSQLLYALLASETHGKRDVLSVREVEKLYDAQAKRSGKDAATSSREYLNAQLLNMCESNHDFATAVAVLDNWQHSTRAPLSKRAAKRVFELVSQQLQLVEQQRTAAAAATSTTSSTSSTSTSTIQENARHDDDDEDEDEENGYTAGVRYKVGGAELSFRGMLERYPVLLPLNAWSLGHALMRSATAGLTEDVATLLRVAQQKHFVLEPVVYKASLDVLQTAASATRDGDDTNTAAAASALRECVAGMKKNGSWDVLRARFPVFAADLRP